MYLSDFWPRTRKPMFEIAIVIKVYDRQPSASCRKSIRNWFMEPVCFTIWRPEAIDDKFNMMIWIVRRIFDEVDLNGPLASFEAANPLPVFSVTATVVIIIPHLLSVNPRH